MGRRRDASRRPSIASSCCPARRRRPASPAIASAPSRSAARPSRSSTPRRSRCARRGCTSGWASTHSWDDRAALDCYEQALRVLPPGPLPERARLLAAQGHALMGLRRWEESRDRCEAALAAAGEVRDRSPRPGSRSGSSWRSSATPAPASAQRAPGARGRGAARRRRGHGPRLRAPRASSFASAATHAAALEAMVTGERIAARLGMRGTFGHFMYVNAADDLAAPRPLGRGGAAARARPSGWSSARRPARCTTPSPAICTRCAASRRASRAHLERATELADEGLPGEFVTPIHGAWAALALTEGDPEVARRHVDAALAAEGDDKDPLYTPALYSLGVRAEADIAERARARRREDDAAAAAARAEALLADLGRLLSRSAAVPGALAHGATANAEHGRATGNAGPAALGGGRTRMGRAERAPSGGVRACAPGRGPPVRGARPARRRRAARRGRRDGRGARGAAASRGGAGARAAGARAAGAAGRAAGAAGRPPADAAGERRAQARSPTGSRTGRSPAGCSSARRPSGRTWRTSSRSSTSTAASRPRAGPTRWAVMSRAST